MTSTDLVHWRARRRGPEQAWRRGRPRRRIGIAHPRHHLGADGGAVRPKRFVHAYATRCAAAGRARCASPSRASRSPLGAAFVDRTPHAADLPGRAAPSTRRSSPAPSGARYLLWKSEQTPARPASSSSTGSPATARELIGAPRLLLTTQDAVGVAADREPVDDPLPRAGTTSSTPAAPTPTTRYATGYAVCRTPIGPCTRAAPRRCSRPAVASPARWGDGVRRPARPAAPGLRRLGLRQHRLPEVEPSCRRQPAGCPQRKLHVATLGRTTDGSAGGDRPWLVDGSRGRASSLRVLLASGLTSASARPDRPAGGQRPVPPGDGLPRRLPGPDRAAGRHAPSTRPPRPSPR